MATIAFTVVSGRLPCWFKRRGLAGGREASGEALNIAAGRTQESQLVAGKFAEGGAGVAEFGCAKPVPDNNADNTSDNMSVNSLGKICTRNSKTK